LQRTNSCGTSTEGAAQDATAACASAPLNGDAPASRRRFTALDDLTAHELEATAGALERRKDGLRDFASIFRNVADARQGGWDSDLPHFHLGQTRGFIQRSWRRFTHAPRGANSRKEPGAAATPGS
jgi:hypothetical protein